MSAPEQAAAAVLAQVALAADGAVLGIALAYVAVRSFLKFASASSALGKIRQAPSLRVSDLRSVLFETSPSDHGSQSSDERIVVVRGVVEAKTAADGNWRGTRNNGALVAPESGEKAVVVQQTQTCIYNEWRGFLGWTSDLRSIFSRSWKEHESTSIRTVPFILVDDGRWSGSDYVTVNLEGSRHPLPLTTTFHRLQPVNASPYTFLQALFGHEYPVGLLDEEKIIPLGKDINAVGSFSLRDGFPEIKSCKDLPYFLSDMTKDQMVTELSFRIKILFWSGVVLASVSIGMLGYAITRNWNRWKEWRLRRRARLLNPPADDDGVDTSRVAAEEEGGDVPDGQLCVICLMRRRRSAFIPCGHLVCCHRCALTVACDLAPKCPVCRQPVRNSVRIYSS